MDLSPSPVPPPFSLSVCGVALIIPGHDTADQSATEVSKQQSLSVRISVKAFALALCVAWPSGTLNVG